MENKLKRRYKNQRGDMLQTMKKTNPKRFYRKFKRRKTRINSILTLEQFEEHFKNLISNNEVNSAQDSDPDETEPVYEELDVPFTESEIDMCIKNLKRDKATGLDNIMNKYIIFSRQFIKPVLCKLFNCILNSGSFPELCAKSIVVPVYKKGQPNDPGNYRGIYLASHIGKLFTALINSRLTRWSEKHSVITDAQFRFRPGFGTTDAIFALHSLTSKSFRSGKRLYCCFIDYEKAFDSVLHTKLWLRIVKCGMTGKLLNIIKSMYSQIKCCIKFNGVFSNFFNSNIGLTQGESLPPFLYSFYVNDMEI